MSLPKKSSGAESSPEASHLGGVEAVRARTFGKQDRDDNAMAWKHGMLTNGKIRRSTVSLSSSRHAGVPMIQAANLGDARKPSHEEKTACHVPICAS